VARVPSPQAVDEVQIAPAGALASFDRWERQTWTVAELDLAHDRAGWSEMPSFLAAELRFNVDRFFLGEAAVTETLAPLAHSAPEAEWQLYLCTQLSDEARHTMFFVRYLEAVGVREPDGELRDYLQQRWDETPSHFTELLDRQLREVTTRAWTSNDEADWFRAVTLYHLVVEGVLAVTGQRRLLDIIGDRPGLATLQTGILNIARDESRHIGFGVGALREGVRRGFGDAITAQLEQSVPPAARIALSPERPLPGLLPARVQRSIGTDFERRLGKAGEALAGRVERIGLAGAAAGVRRMWESALGEALDDYRSSHGREHPLRAAQAVRS
jgi:ribonucleoside-diphosphate reductase beta chain